MKPLGHGSTKNEKKENIFSSSSSPENMKKKRIKTKPLGTVYAHRTHQQEKVHRNASLFYQSVKRIREVYDRILLEEERYSTVQHATVSHIIWYTQREEHCDLRQM